MADGPDEAQARATEILGMDIKGHRVNAVLVEEASDIAREFYLSFLVDRAARTFTSICSVQGGVEIEEVAHASPGAVAQIMIDPLTRDIVMNEYLSELEKKDGKLHQRNLAVIPAVKDMCKELKVGRCGK